MIVYLVCNISFTGVSSWTIQPLPHRPYLTAGWCQFSGTALCCVPWLLDTPHIWTVAGCWQVLGHSGLCLSGCQLGIVGGRVPQENSYAMYLVLINTRYNKDQVMLFCIKIKIEKYNLWLLISIKCRKANWKWGGGLDSSKSKIPCFITTCTCTGFCNFFCNWSVKIT